MNRKVTPSISDVSSDSEMMVAIDVSQGLLLVSLSRMMRSTIMSAKI